MIEKLLQNNSFKSNNPIKLKDCTLFLRLQHFKIDDVFLFHRQDVYSFTTVGELWVQGRIQTEFNNKGYFSSKIYTFEYYDIFNYFEEYSDEEISIIGYFKKKRVQVLGISLIKENMDLTEGFTFKFSFMDLKFY